MNENSASGIQRLEEAFRRHDRLYLEKYPPKPLPRKKRKTIGKRAITVLIAATMLLCSVLAVSAVKTPLGKWITNAYQEFIEIFFENENILPSTGEIPSEMPSGYHLTEKFLSEYESKHIWKNEKGEMIIWTQLPLSARNTFDNEKTDRQTLMLGETEIIRTEKNGRKTYAWHTDAHFFTLVVPNTLAEEECLRIIQTPLSNH